ncbi:hypothetical protein FHR72_003913 [Mycolicibacterium iranicum]|uniref:PE-PGRS family protein n=1 Tax=Mycolicibacterium iranicum TaxID=912594 RepID=A0A839QC75_MYCIR|nr:hypothetical protein [Mycolicibacterium iranicum]MBB2992414.1 hypothetical protein [Mycolicibacterium iranicum]
MHVAVRPYLATGVALVGAGAIAVAPVHLPLPEVEIPTVSSAAVQLAAQPNPIALWTQVFGAAIDNIGGLGEEVLSDPLPVLRQILKNQFGYLQTVAAAGKGIIEGLADYVSPDNPFGLQAGIRDAFAQIEQGNIAAGVATLTSTLVLGPVISGIGLPLLQSGLLEVPGAIAQNLANAVAALFDNANAVPLLTAVVGPIVAPINAFGASVQEIVEALGAGDLIEALTAVINVPARIIGAVLNGYTDELGNTLPGLLTVSDNPFGAGLIQAVFVNIPRAIAAAIGAEPATTRQAGVLDEVSSPTIASAATVTVSLTETGSATTEPTAAADTVSPDPAEVPAAPAAEETPAEEAPADAPVEEPTDGSVEEPTDGSVQEPTDGDGAPVDDGQQDEAGSGADAGTGAQEEDTSDTDGTTDTDEPSNDTGAAGGDSSGGSDE